MWEIGKDEFGNRSPNGNRAVLAETEILDGEVYVLRRGRMKGALVRAWVLPDPDSMEDRWREGGAFGQLRESGYGLRLNAVKGVRQVGVMGLAEVWLQTPGCLAGNPLAAVFQVDVETAEGELFMWGPRYQGPVGCGLRGLERAHDLARREWWLVAFEGLRETRRRIRELMERREGVDEGRV